MGDRAVSANIEKLHNQIKEMSLGDLMIVIGSSINMKMEKKRVEIMMHYLEEKLLRYKLNQEPEKLGGE